MRKPGYLTSEFWLVAVTLVLNNLGALQVPERFSWIVTLGVVVGYALSRAIAKVGGPVVDLQPVHPEEVARTTAQRRELERDLKRAKADCEGGK